ncbi:hypothetical protein ACRPFF_10730 [Neisseria sp. SLRRB23]
MVIGSTDIDALGGNVDVTGGGNITAGLAVGAAGIYPYAAFQAADGFGTACVLLPTAEMVSASLS